MSKMMILFSIGLTLSLSAFSASADVEPSIIKDAMYNFDAADTSTLTMDTDGQVSKWKNKGYSGGEATPWKNDCLPIYSNRIVDFGETGSKKDMRFPFLNKIRTVFWVMDIEQDPNAFLLGTCSKSNVHDFHRGEKGEYIPAKNAYTPVKNGSFYDNGLKVSNPSGTKIPTGLRIISFVAGSKVGGNAIRADSLTCDQNKNNRSGGRGLAQILIFDKRLEDTERQEIGFYLAGKWGLLDDLHIFTNTWTGGDGNWSESENWENGSFQQSAFIDFPVGSGTVNVDSESTVVRLSFSGNYALTNGNGSITLFATEGNVQVEDNITATILAPISGPLMKKGNGTLIFDPTLSNCQAYSFEGGISLNGKTLEANFDLTGSTTLKNGTYVCQGEQPWTAAQNSILTIEEGATLNLGYFRPGPNVALDPASTGTLMITIDQAHEESLLSATEIPTGLNIILQNSLGETISTDTLTIKNGALTYTPTTPAVASPFSVTLNGDANWSTAEWKDANGESVTADAWLTADQVEIRTGADGYTLTVDTDVVAASVTLLGDHSLTLVFSKEKKMAASVINGTDKTLDIDLSGYQFTNEELADSDSVTIPILLKAPTGVTFADKSPILPARWNFEIEKENGITLLLWKCGTATKAPAVISKAELHFDASNLESLEFSDNEYGKGITKWNDISPSQNHASIKNRDFQPRYVNGVVDFRQPYQDHNIGRDLTFNRLADIKTVFWVIDIEQSPNAFLLGDDQAQTFFRGENGEYAHTSKGLMKNGTFHNNGEIVLDSTTTKIPVGMQLISFTAGDTDSLIASSLTKDCKNPYRNGGRKLAELIVFNRKLDNEDRMAVESYLRNKWADYLGIQIWTGNDGNWSDTAQWNASPWRDMLRTVFPVNNGGKKITVDTDVDTMSLDFNDSYTLLPGAGTLSISSGDFFVSPEKTATIQTPFITDAQGQLPLSKLGEGTLELAGTNTSSNGCDVLLGTLSIAENAHFQGKQSFSFTDNSALLLAGTQEVSQLSFGSYNRNIKFAQKDGEAKSRLYIMEDTIFGTKNDVEQHLTLDGIEMVFAPGKTFCLSRGPYKSTADMTLKSGSALFADSIVLANAYYKGEFHSPDCTGVLNIERDGKLICKNLTMEDTNRDVDNTKPKGILNIKGGTVFLNELKVSEKNHDKVTKMERVIHWEGGAIHNYDKETDLIIPNILTAFTVTNSENVLNVFQIDGERKISVHSPISGDGGIVICGKGTFETSGTHTYTGGTRVEASTFCIADTLQMGDLTLADGASIEQLKGTNTIGRLTLKTGATMKIDAGKVTFADSSATEWSPEAKLMITGKFEPDIIRFGESSKALTKAQLQKITWNKHPVTLDHQGYLMHPPATILMLE